MKKVFRVILSLFILSFISTLYSAVKYTPQIEDPILEGWRWRHLSKLDGQGVRCMVEDNDHNMWFGVDKGVIKYDGLNWTSFNSNSGLIDAPVFSLLSTKDGTLLAGSAGGISHYNNGNWQPLFPDTSLSNLKITQMIELDDGSVLCASNYGLIQIIGSGIFIYTSEKNQSIFRGNVPDDKIFVLPKKYTLYGSFNIAGILQEKNKRIWIAVGYDNNQSGLLLTARLNKNRGLQSFKLHYFEGRDKKFNNGVHLFQSANGTVWNLAEQFDKSIVLFNNGIKNEIKLSHQFGGDDIYTSIIQTSDNTIFIGGLGRFFTLKNNVWKEYKAPVAPVPTSNRIILYVDSRGYIWMAGKQNEVFLLDYTASSWVTYLDLNYQAQEENGALWFVDIYSRIIRNDRKDWIAFSEKDGAMSHAVRVFITTKGGIWSVGSHRGTACAAYYENGRWEKILFPELSWGIEVRGVFEDFSGSLWFGCNIDIKYEQGHKGGIIQFPDPFHNKDLFIQYLLPQKEIGVYGIGQSKDNKIWVAGITTCYFDQNKWTPAEYPPEFQYHTDCMNMSPDSILWVGSRNYGLFRFDGKEWSKFTINDGLISNSITSILAESDSSVWVATAKGISYFDGKGWINNIFPSEVNIVKEGGELRMDRKGNLWINKASRKWYRRILTSAPIEALRKEGFKTVLYRPDTLAPETHIVHYEKEVSQIGNTTISWTGDDYFDKTPIRNLQYSYRLDRKEWTPFSLNTSQFFSGLSSGDHIFEIRARDLDFNIDPTPVRIDFNVLYPFYLQPLFLIPILTLFLISVVLLLRVIKRGRQLRLAKRETDVILSNIKQGLFLLDDNLTLGSQYSTFLINIFDEENLYNKNFIDLLKDRINEKNIEAIKSYLEIMFRPDLDEPMLDELNPFDEIKFKYAGNLPERYFSFRFRKVSSIKEDSDSKNIIVVVQDITEQITLSRELKSAREDASRKMNWLLDILHVEPGLLQEFLGSSEQEITKIFDLLDNPEMIKNPQPFLETMYRSMHLLKGNAGLLALNTFAEEAHHVEDIISEFQNKEKITVDDVETLRSKIIRISSSIHDVTSLLDKLSTIHKQMRTKRGFENEQLQKSLSNLIKQIAEDNDKKVKLISDKFKLQDFPYNKRLIIRETLIQLIKNAIVHGIEREDERKKQNKTKTGAIEITSFKNKQDYGFKVRDDGRGIRLEKLREKLVESGKVSKDEIHSWSPERIAASIFFSGISTAINVDINAGRGIGLGAVKDKIESAGGKIEIDFKENKFCEFTVRFPNKESN